MRFFVLISLAFYTSILSSSACSIFNAIEENTVLVGNNEDWNSVNNSIIFYPPSTNKYGRMLLKIDKNGYPFGGINDQGLFFDWCALTRRTDIEFPTDRLNYDGTLCEKLLEECATITEAINLYEKYNDPWLYEGHLMIVDRSGNSVIIEWGKDSLEIIKKDKQYQVLTNFNITDPDLAGWYPCWRYTKATEMLKNAEHFNVELFKNILDDVHQEGDFQTIYSVIYNLKDGIIYMYNLHNYINVVKIDLSNELSKGEKHYNIQDIFSQLNLNFPLQEQLISSNSVTFSWQGDAFSYELYCSKDSLFTNCDPVLINMDTTVRSGFSSIPAIFISLLIIAALYKKRKFLLTILAQLFIVFLSCEKETDSMNERIERLALSNTSYTLENLEPNTRYYWKIDACNSVGIITESEVRTFTSGSRK